MIACILQAVIINATTLPVFCNKFKMKGVISLKPETTDKDATAKESQTLRTGTVNPVPVQYCKTAWRRPPVGRHAFNCWE